MVDLSALMPVFTRFLVRGTGSNAEVVFSTNATAKKFLRELEEVMKGQRELTLEAMRAALR